jgi:hypothetical protein
MSFRPPLPRPKPTSSKKEPGKSSRKWEPKPKTPARPKRK